MESQAKRVIGKFGGISKMSARTGFAKSTVQRWLQAGFIKPKHTGQILDAAVTHQIPLEVVDFVSVDTSHAAFAVNAASTQGADDRAGHIGRSSLGPISENQQEPLPDTGEAAAASSVDAHAAS